MKWIKSLIEQWVLSRKRMTPTESAFHAKETLDKMCMYIYEHKLHTCVNINDDVQRKYNIDSYPDIWTILCQIKEIKEIKDHDQIIEEVIRTYTEVYKSSNKEIRDEQHN